MPQSASLKYWGSFVSIFQYRRRFLSTLSEIYAAQSGRQPTDIVCLSGELRQELITACALAPFAFLDLRAPAAPSQGQRKL